MRTAEEMLNYTNEHDFGHGFKSWDIKHFKVVESHLLPDEEALICFIGIHNYISSSNHESHFAYAITNKRMVFGQKTLLGENFKSVIIENINDITKQTGFFNGIITFDTFKEKFNVDFVPQVADKLFPVLNEYITNLKNKKNNKVEENQKNDPTAELRKYKQLLDDGIITQEDFNAKKKQILGL